MMTIEDNKINYKSGQNALTVNERFCVIAAVSL